MLHVARSVRTRLSHCTFNEPKKLNINGIAKLTQTPPLLALKLMVHRFNLVKVIDGEKNKDNAHGQCSGSATAGATCMWKYRSHWPLVDITGRQIQNHLL